MEVGSGLKGKVVGQRFIFKVVNFSRLGAFSKDSKAYGFVILGASFTRVSPCVSDSESDFANDFSLQLRRKAAPSLLGFAEPCEDVGRTAGGLGTGCSA